MLNERGRIHEHKAPFRKQLSAHAFKAYSFFSVHVRDAFRNSTWSLSRGLCFQVRNSQHSLFFCWRWQLSNSVVLLRVPFWIGGELPVCKPIVAAAVRVAGLRRSWRWRCWIWRSWAGVVKRGLRLVGWLDILSNIYIYCLWNAFGDCLW